MEKIATSDPEVTLRQRAIGIALLLSACGVSERVPVPDMTIGGPAEPDLGSVPADLPAPYEDAVVYGHSPRDLYRIDPTSLAITHVGLFDFGGANESMTDIAVDAAGRLTGISFNALWSIDPATARCTRLATLDRQLTGLSYVDYLGGQRLLGAAKDDGAVFSIDPQSGVSTQIGSYGNGLVSSGDLVSVTGFGTMATVRKGTTGGDWLARVDEATGAATLIGAVGRANVWGLGFWRNRLFGFSSLQGFMTIDPKTGQATTVPGGEQITWWGAGVTTAAPVIQ